VGFQKCPCGPGTLGLPSPCFLRTPEARRLHCAGAEVKTRPRWNDGLCAVAGQPSHQAPRPFYRHHLILMLASKCRFCELCTFTPPWVWKNTPSPAPSLIPTFRKFFQVWSTLETWLLGRWL